MDYKNDTPWSGYPPVYARVLTTGDVDRVVLQSDSGERPVEITNFTQRADGRIFEGNFYFKQPGFKTLYANGYSSGTFKGSDYVKVNILQPPPEYWLALELNEEAIENLLGFVMNVMPWGVPGGENVFGYTAPYGCYEREFTLEANNTYTNIPPIQIPEPPYTGVDCLLPENALSCIDECIRCPEPKPEFVHPPVPALWLGSGVKLHIYLRIKEIDFHCGFATSASFGIITCHEDNLSSVGARIEGLKIEYDLVPALLVTDEVEWSSSEGVILPQTIPSPPYKPFFLIRNFTVHDIEGVVAPCVPNWIAEEAIEAYTNKYKFEDSYQINLQAKSEWGTYYFTGGIQVHEEIWPEHKVHVNFEYLPGLRDN